MKISYNWLKSFLSYCPPREDLAAILTNCGLEVEGIEHFESVKGGLKGIIIGEVVSCDKHPNADRLSVCKVNIGNKHLQNIVCGAPNVATGQKVAVALPGATLFPVKGEPFELKQAKIRGVESEGMICAEDEVGLGTEHAGIMVLDSSAVTGTPAKNYFQIEEDTIFEIGLTPNRGDAASHIGVARDVAAAVNAGNAKKDNKEPVCRLKFPPVDNFREANGNNPFAKWTNPSSGGVEVIIEDKAGCPRYSGLSLSGVTVKDSPPWLKNRLRALGLKPVNNLVDIASFVMLECGQPLHVFDSDKITGGKVIVKKLPEGTKFTTLDGIERILSSGDLMICDAGGGMCMAGVFGGLQSGVSGTTADIFIESACFNPVTIRKTSRHHRLFTDASFRFERATDPLLTVFALKRAALLIMETAGGKIASGIIDNYPEPVSLRKIKFSYAYCNRLAGTVIERDTIKNILLQLGFTFVNETGNDILLSVPPYKADIKRPADVAEEILRIYGYNNVPFSNRYASAISYREKPDVHKVRNIISDMLASLSFSEIISNSLSRSGYYEPFSEETRNRLIPVLSPASAELNILRQCMLFSGLEVIAYNRNRQKNDLKIFEFGKCYERKKLNGGTGNPLGEFSETEHLALFVTGRKYPEGWTMPAAPADYYQLKGYVQKILNRLGFSGWYTKETGKTSAVFGSGQMFLLNNRPVVQLGRVNKKITRMFDIPENVFYADFDFSLLWTLPRMADDKIRTVELPRFPHVRRDLALLLDRNTPYSGIERIARIACGALLKEVVLFDIYEGAQIPSGKKSYAVGFIFQDEKKTFADEEINRTMEKIIDALKKQLAAEIR